MRPVLLIVLGQSNARGAARSDNGGTVSSAVSLTRGKTPSPQSFLPKLMDLAARRGIALDAVNVAIGGSAASHWTGRVGATVTGGLATLPISQGFMSPVDLSGGTTPCVEGGAGFDPFGFLADARTKIQAAAANYRDIWALWSNGESDSTTSRSLYSAALTSIGNHIFGSGVTRFYIGLSSKPSAFSAAGYDALQLGVSDTITALKSSGKPALSGADMYARWGEYPPHYAETDRTTYVHLTERGQELHAKAWDAAIFGASAQ